MPVFLDTNILLYSVGTFPEEQFKRERAWALLDRVDVVLSVQVLQEFYVQATRSSRTDRLDHERAADFITAWRRFSIQANTVETLLDALAIKERYGFSYWDSAVVAAARIAGCSELYTEDLSHGQIIDGVRIINPFHPR